MAEGFPEPDHTALCVCDSGSVAGACCLPVVQGQTLAKTARALMRSRYAAYVWGDEAWLLQSWSAQTRPEQVQLSPKQRWLGLKIKRVEAGGEQDVTGVVEFVARYKVDGRGHRLHEVSAFEREGGAWRYVSGEIMT